MKHTIADMVFWLIVSVAGAAISAQNAQMFIAGGLAVIAGVFASCALTMFLSGDTA